MKKPWSKRYVGYSALVDGHAIAIIAHTRWALRKMHKRLFPDVKFDAKKCHPAQILRLK